MTVEPFAKVLEVDEARSLEVEEDVILVEVEVDEARFLEVEDEAILVEVELARFCFEIDLILLIRLHHFINPSKKHTSRTPSDGHQHTYPPSQVQSIPIPLHPDQKS